MSVTSQKHNEPLACVNIQPEKSTKSHKTTTLSSNNTVEPIFFLSPLFRKFCDLTKITRCEYSKFMLFLVYYYLVQQAKTPKLRAAKITGFTVLQSVKMIRVAKVQLISVLETCMNSQSYNNLTDTANHKPLFSGTTSIICKKRTSTRHNLNKSARITPHIVSTDMDTS